MNGVEVTSYRIWGNGPMRTAIASITVDGRPWVAIDAEDREQVERLMSLYVSEAVDRGAIQPQFSGQDTKRRDAFTAALREFANPRLAEPSDPAARVTDRRDNIWRLLADGDWVCTSGPDIGEYLTWDRLAGTRGPLTVEVQS